MHASRMRRARVAGETRTRLARPHRRGDVGARTLAVLAVERAPAARERVPRGGAAERVAGGHVRAREVRGVTPRPRPGAHHRTQRAGRGERQNLAAGAAAEKLGIHAPVPAQADADEPRGRGVERDVARGAPAGDEARGNDRARALHAREDAHDGRFVRAVVAAAGMEVGARDGDGDPRHAGGDHRGEHRGGQPVLAGAGARGSGHTKHQQRGDEPRGDAAAPAGGHPGHRG